MSHQKELTDLENGPASVAGVVAGDGAAAPASSAQDHVLDFNISNFSTPAGKQILHDVGTCCACSWWLGWAGLNDRWASLIVVAPTSLLFPHPIVTSLSIPPHTLQRGAR